VLGAAGETEIKQGNIQNWLQLDEGGPGFQLVTEEEIAAVMFLLFIFSSALPTLLNFPVICFINFLFVFQSYILSH
jgi:hypothetical protein